MKTFFYIVGNSGIQLGLRAFHKFIDTPNRKIRWATTSVEYGLIEGTVINRGAMLQVSGSALTTSIHYEQVKEIALTKEEADELGFGWPFR